MKTFAIAATLITLSAGNVQAVDRHIDDVAFDVQNQTAALVREIKYGYRHHPEFAHLYEDAVEMARHAAVIHSIAHHHTPSAQLAREVSALDETFHHVEEVIAEANRTNQFNINRYHATRALQVLALLEETIHHLQDDLTPAVPALQAPPVQVQPTYVQPRPPIYTPAYNTPVYNGYRNGYTYRSNNGRFTIHVGH
jgi:hypothetical protein